MKYLIFLFVTLIVYNNALADVFHWAPYTDSRAEDLIIYRGVGSMTCEDMFVISDTSLTSYNTGVANTSIAFYVMTARGGGEESGFSNEIIAKYCDGSYCQADFTASASSNGVLLIWEQIDSVTGYQIRYKETNDASYTTLDNQTSPAFIDLNPNDYEFHLYAKDALGRTIETSNVYPTLYATVSNQPSPSLPNYKVEAFGTNGVAGWNQTLMVASEEIDPNVEYHRLVIFTSSALALSGSSDGALSDALVPYGSNFCPNIDTAGYPILFFTVSDIDYNGQESDLRIGYKLIGNVTETDNDGTAFSDSMVNLGDYNILRAYYYKPFTQRSPDYCSEPNLYDILPFTYQERMDYNLDGIVNGAEYNFFRAVYTHTGAGY